MGDNDVDAETVEEANRLVGPGAEHHRHPVTSTVPQDLHCVLEPRRPVSIAHQCLGPAHTGAGPGSEKKPLSDQWTNALSKGERRSPLADPE